MTEGGDDNADGLSAENLYDVRPDPKPDTPPEPMPAAQRRPDPEPQPLRPSPRRRLPILKWLGLTVLSLICFSIVQVCVYRFVPVPITILMIDRLIAGDGLDHRWVGSDRISPNLKSAVIAAEDAKFCTHNGFDVDAIKKAEKYNATHRRKRGASTISQQTAKNVFLWPSRSWTRKGFEVWYTFLIEHLWPKDRIMEVYLNSVEWGPGVFGAESASQYWFHHSAATLSPAEASKLAAILPDPRKWKAAHSGSYVAKRSGSIEARARVVDNSGYDACAVD
ncbi:MAG: monofunctional biosynthetic peptidoglycan transglycosylase [Asticcacaulis sp.]